MDNTECMQYSLQTGQPHNNAPVPSASVILYQTASHYIDSCQSDQSLHQAAKSMCIAFFCLNPYEAPSPAPVPEQPANSRQKKSTKTKAIRKRLRDELKRKPRQSHANEGSYECQNQKGRIKFILAFNRDEQCERRTLRLGAYQEDPHVYAGRDTRSTGTWLGVNVRTGIMVFLTNYDLPVFRPGKSRGQLVKSFLKLFNQPALVSRLIRQKLMEVLAESNNYSAFNLVVYNMKGSQIFYICSELGLKEPLLLQKSTPYGLCNTDINTMWPKTQHGLTIFEDLLPGIYQKSNSEAMDLLFNKLMRDRKRFSADPNDQAAIFLDPFYSTLEDAERMTKSTFLAILREKQTRQGIALQLSIRQITHKNPRHRVESLTLGRTRSSTKRQTVSSLDNSQEPYDHYEETQVDYTFNI